MAEQIFIALHARGILLAAIRIFCWSTLLLLLVMVAHKLMIEWSEKRMQRLKRYYLSGCYRRLSQPDFILEPPSGRAACLALMDVLIFLLNDKQLAHNDGLRHIAREFDLADHFQTVVTRSRSWVRRLMAAEKLGFLSLPELAPFFRQQLARERDLQVQAKLIWGLSRIAAADDAWLISRTLAQQPNLSAKFNELVYWNMIDAFRRRHDEEGCLALVETLLDSPELPDLQKRDLVESCGVSLFTAAVPLIRRSFARYPADPTMKIACLRAIGTLGGDQDGTMTAQSLSDQDWRVRAVAARYAYLTPCSLIPQLSLLLGDPHYPVRLNCALALNAMGEAGRTMLRQCLASSDQFVRDVCAHMLEEV